ncbi:hypothetical protein A2U01_0038473, partial [Trifolium medium]|nr:hypothetical protein [Trifolium medium]
MDSTYLADYNRSLFNEAHSSIVASRVYDILK